MNVACASARSPNLPSAFFSSRRNFRFLFHFASNCIPTTHVFPNDPIQPSYGAVYRV